MKTRTFYFLPAVAIFLLAGCTEPSTGDDQATHDGEEMHSDHDHGDGMMDEDEHAEAHRAAAAIENLKMENLRHDTLEIVDGLEVFISYLEVPANTTFPMHYHPGEEFAYIIEGSGDLILKDKSTRTLHAGDADKVPLRQVHTFSTHEESAKLVVFRVHESGQPERILVEETESEY